ncbi:MAG TPA: cation diffusion facilitator family transporter [Acidimicrobiales bacterium]|nr:cation diffusion facilitator family transporter [Acidimicrobiales bacterium]
MSAGGGAKAIIAAFLANLGIAVAKFVGFAFTGSASMLAEAIHSTADTTNQGLLMLGRRQARRPANPEHPFGYGRERFFWSFVVALVIFSFGAVFALFEGIEKMREPHELDSVGWAVGILMFAIGAETFSFRTAIQESLALKGDGSWWQFIRHSKVPELPVVLLEDLGALIGLVFALVGIALAELTGNARFDAMGSIAIGVLLAIIAVTLVVEMKSLLIGESATAPQRKLITDVIESHPKTARLIHIKTEHLGPEELLVGAKIDFGKGVSSEQLAASIDEVEQSIRAAVPEARVIYIEPDIFRP